MRKLFLLEDDLSLISGLTFAFKKQGFALDTARTLAEAEVLWSDGKYDLLVLDVFPAGWLWLRFLPEGAAHIQRADSVSDRFG